jgi:hypothetical protein
MPKARVRFEYASESDKGPYPIPSSVPIEGQPRPDNDGDRHALIVDRDTCRLFELYALRRENGAWVAGSGAIWNLRANKLRPAGWTSADAAGLPILPGLVRYDEVAAGEIAHAIRFTVDCTTRRYLWPARHQAGVADRSCPPMGARFRLRSGFRLAGFRDETKVVLRAMKRYGMIVADNGSDWYFQGATDERWTDGLLDELKSVPASAFVAVDESACKVSPDSGAFAYGPGCPAPN